MGTLGQKRFMGGSEGHNMYRVCKKKSNGTYHGQLNARRFKHVAGKHSNDAYHIECLGVGKVSSHREDDAKEQAIFRLLCLTSCCDNIQGNMVLAMCSDTGYLNEPKAWIRAGGCFFLSNNEEFPFNNGSILNIVKIIKVVISSAAEAEL